MSNEITAYFKGRIGVAESVYQYDYGMVLVIDGLDFVNNFDCYFSTSGDDDAIPAIGSDNRVAIPNSCLTRAGDVTLHIPAHTGENDSEVEHVVTFRVIGRARPVDDGTEEEQSAVSKAIALLNHTNSSVIETIDAYLDDNAAEPIQAWLDEHPEATTTVQDHSLTYEKLVIGTLGYVTPEMFGAEGDGIADDTLAIQTAFDSGHLVLLNNKYGISDSISITKDISVICSEESEILPLANIDVLVAVGTESVSTDNPVLSGLIKAIWHGGKINCKNGNYTASVGIELGKLYHSKFSDISVVNVSNTGVKYSGTYGALAICENVVVRGIENTLCEIGFDIRRNDQRLYNCSAVDCKVGFYLRTGYIRLIGCGVWVSHSNGWMLTTGYVIDANDCSLVECTCDTLFTGLLFSSNAKTCAITNLFWLCATSVISDYTGMRLFVGADANNYVSVNCLVIGLQAQAYTMAVQLKKYIADDNKFSILGISTPNSNYITDAATAIDMQSISNKSKIIGDWYSANMKASPTTANDALTETMTLPAGRYIVTFNPSYITGLGTGGSACRLMVGSSSGNYHYLKNGWNEGFSEIIVLSTQSTVYVQGADSITHQNNAGSGIRAIRIT